MENRQEYAERKYPDCYDPLKIRTQSEVVPTKRPPLKEWLKKIKNYKLR